MSSFWFEFVLYLFLAVTATAEETFIAKLVGVKNPNVKRTHRLEGRNEVFATRATSFLKKDGDLFKVHRPGLLGKANTVSFESVRLPGFFLRQKNKKVHLDNLKSRYILKDATFKESRNGIGENFRLFLHDNLYICHEQNRGLSLFMFADSPKRDKFNCAFNIVQQAGTKNEAVVTEAPGKAKDHVSTYVKNKATGESYAEFKDLVNAIKQNKDPFPSQAGEGLVVVSGQPAKEAKENAKPSAVKNAKTRTAATKQMAALNKGAAPKAHANKPARKNIAANAGPKLPLGSASLRPLSSQKMQPQHEKDTSFFKPVDNQWVKGNAKMPQSNSYYKQLRYQQDLAKKRAFMKQHALMKQHTFARQQALKGMQYSNNMNTYFANKNKLNQQRLQDVAASNRQIVSHIFPAPISNPIGQPIQYIPPSQWSHVMSLNEGSLIHKPVQAPQWTHNAQDLIKSHSATSSYAADNLLTKLHPELNLIHNAHHDVNEVVTSDPNIHHIDLNPVVNPPFLNHPTPVQITTMPHETATHEDLAEAAREPVAAVEHITLPSATPIAGHSNEVSVHVEHVPSLMVSVPHPSVVTSNLEAAHELVHTHPDITLQEAFDKMEPIHSHPIEIGSESVHHIHSENQPDKAFHMRTHYVTGKPVDMSDGSEDDNMKEVHVVHHNHHLVHTANEEEQQKFVSTLVNTVDDLCISLVFINELDDRYRLVSTINPHGYRPKGKKFSLKTIFKEPKTRKVMSFKGYDEEDSHRPVLLNGHKEYNVYPISCAEEPKKVVVDSVVSKNGLVTTGTKKNEVSAHKRQSDSCTRVSHGTDGPGACCVFPFVFNGQTFDKCIPFRDGEEKQKWCSLTSNFDAERRWGMCSIPDLGMLQAEPAEEDKNPLCPSKCNNECGKDCPMACCSDSTSSLLH